MVFCVCVSGVCFLVVTLVSLSFLSISFCIVFLFPWALLLDTSKWMDGWIGTWRIDHPLSFWHYQQCMKDIRPKMLQASKRLVPHLQTSKSTPSKGGCLTLEDVKSSPDIIIIVVIIFLQRPNVSLLVSWYRYMYTPTDMISSYHCRICLSAFWFWNKLASTRYFRKSSQTII